MGYLRHKDAGFVPPTHQRLPNLIAIVHIDPQWARTTQFNAPLTLTAANHIFTCQSRYAYPPMTDTTIYHAMLVGASMGLAICASPEILILGLLMAANRAAPRRNTALFFIGGFIGLSALLILGASLTASDPTGPIQPSMHRFIVKATFGTALIALGTFRAWQYLFGAAPEPKAPNEKQSHIKNLLDVLFPTLSERTVARHQMGLHYFLSSLVIGFISTALNPKIIPFAMLVGH
jgi:hypothetical protein